MTTTKSLRRVIATALTILVCSCALDHTLIAGEQRPAEKISGGQPLPSGLAPSDLVKIRAAYQAHQHAAIRTSAGYRAHNPGQQWIMEFEGQGFAVRPEVGGWEWGLELKSYGFTGQKQTMSGKAQVTAVGGRVIYGWESGLCEWFINDARGLEHGFTLENPPAQAKDSPDGELEFDFAIRGNLQAEVVSQGTLRFQDEQGGAVLTYSGLKVWDADGRNLVARFIEQETGVRLAVATRGARYPITIDPIAQQAYLKASNTDISDTFGKVLAISGDTIVVGAGEERSNATGINGDQTNNTALQAGAAYVFVRNGTSWSQQAYLKASNTQSGDRFGDGVAISGDTIVVGAQGEDSNATGVNGNQADNSLLTSGAVYVFVRNGTTWSQQAYLKASNTGQADFFGFKVAISGDVIAVGASGEDSAATGVNGDQNSNAAESSGAVYIFSRTGSTWSQEAYLKASNTEGSDFFGWEVAVSGETVLVGAYQEDSAATGVNGDQSSNGASQSGAAYVFVRNGTTWSQQAYLKASNTGTFDAFGSAIAISGDIIAIGASAEDSSATGVNGDQNNNSAGGAGAVYIFTRNGASWSQEAYVKASNTNAADAFGDSVALAGGLLAVGASGEASNAVGINGNQSNNSLRGAGAAYVFARQGTTWTQQTYLKASNPDVDDFFGSSIAMSGDTVVVGSYLEDSNATGVNGDQSNNAASASGAAYVFGGLGIASPSQLLNIATRMRVQTGENVIIGGFIITGTDSKNVIIRGIGPSLSSFFSGALANPTLELFQGSTLLQSNNDWKDTQRTEIEATGLQPGNDFESAILRTLPPGSYTAVLRGLNDTTGIAVVEGYDLNTAANSKLANIATRGFVEAGDNVMIGGLIVGPASGSTARVVVRAIGPSLTAFGIAGALQDPTVELKDSNGATLSSNDNWQQGQAAELQQLGLAPTNPQESALVTTLVPGSYTAVVRGVGNTTGVGLVEVYNLQ